MKIPLAKVTIIAESLLEKKIVSLTRQHGATGYTLTKVEGEGSRGVRASDFEGRNIRIEVIVNEGSADAILSDLAETYFEDYAVIAWLSRVDVLRGAKFVGGEPGNGP